MSTPALRRRQAIAVAVMLALHVAGAAPRALLYGMAVARSTLLHVLFVVVEVSILLALSRWRASAAAKQSLGAALFLASCSALTLLQLRLEALAPGSIYPAVLYREAPSVTVTFVAALTGTIFRIALWTLVYVFPLKLEEARGKATEAAELERACALARLRANLEPAQAQRALAEISDCIEADPSGARERLARFAEQLDERSDPELVVDSTPTKKERLPEALVLTPSLQTPLARQRFAVAVVAIVSLFTLSSLARLAERGWDALRLDLVALVRIAIELALFLIIAERAAKRAIPVTRTIGVTLLGSILVGLSMTLLVLRLEAAFPGLFYPPSIYTHPTPAIRQLVRCPRPRH